MVVEEASNTLGLELGELFLLRHQHRRLFAQDPHMPTHRLARLRTQQRRHLVRVRHVVVLELANQLLALLDRDLAPALKGLLRGLDGLVDILLGADWDVPELLAGDGIC